MQKYASLKQDKQVAGLFSVFKYQLMLPISLFLREAADLVDFFYI